MCTPCANCDLSVHACALPAGRSCCCWVAERRAGRWHPTRGHPHSGKGPVLLLTLPQQRRAGEYLFLQTFLAPHWNTWERKSTDKLLLFPQPSVGQVARVDVSSKVEVVWADNSKTIILPQVRSRSSSQYPCNSELGDKSWFQILGPERFTG